MKPVSNCSSEIFLQ